MSGKKTTRQFLFIISITFSPSRKATLIISSIKRYHFLKCQNSDTGFACKVKIGISRFSILFLTFDYNFS